MTAIVIAAGGTAGHVMPALAVAEELSSRGATVSFAGTPSRVEASLVPPPATRSTGSRWTASSAGPRSSSRVRSRAMPVRPSPVRASSAGAAPTSCSAPAATSPVRCWPPRACCASPRCSPRPTRTRPRKPARRAARPPRAAGLPDRGARGCALPRRRPSGRAPFFTADRSEARAALGLPQDASCSRRSVRSPAPSTSTDGASTPTATARWTGIVCHVSGARDLEAGCGRG